MTMEWIFCAKGHGECYLRMPTSLLLAYLNRLKKIISISLLYRFMYQHLGILTKSSTTFTVFVQGDWNAPKLGRMRSQTGESFVDPVAVLRQTGASEQGLTNMPDQCHRLIKANF